MEHVFKTSDGDVKVSMYCSHPQLVNGSSESIGCSGKCHDCSYGKAEMLISDAFKLWELSK